MASVFCSLTLIVLQFFLERAIRLVAPRVTFALQRCFCIDHGDRFIHLSSVLNTSSKTRDSRMLRTTSMVSWIAVAFAGLRELVRVRVVGKSD